MDLADEIPSIEQLERISEPIKRTSSALEAAARWKREAERLQRVADRLEESVLRQISERVRLRQIIALFKQRLPAPVADRWEFTRDELNAAPIRGLKIGELKTGGAFVEL